MRLNALFAAVAASFLAVAHARIFSGSAMEGLEEAANFQVEQLERMRSFLGPQPEDAPQLSKREPVMTFKNPKAKQFHVDGTKIPDGKVINAHE